MKEKLIDADKWIRCYSQEELDKVVLICGDVTNNFDWNKHKDYTVYSPHFTDISYSVKGMNEIPAKEFIESNSSKIKVNDFLFEDGEKFSQKDSLISTPDEKRVKTPFVKKGQIYVENPSDKLLEFVRASQDRKNPCLENLEKMEVTSNYEKMMIEYPNLLKAFEDNQALCKEIFCKKMLDYGISNISAGTVLDNETNIKFALSGLWFRINDKIQRWKNLIFFKKDSVVLDESLEDTFLDVSNYGNIAKIVKDGLWKK